ncbi:MAG: hypothetical protein ABR913_02065 [Sedimentisphaerales bacterium]|jgi:hypothetical protein
MNRQQKIAWFQLAVIAMAAIASAAISEIYVYKDGLNFSKAWWFGTVWPVILGIILMTSAPLLFRKKKGQVDFDERDLTIDRWAARISYGMSYAFLFIICMAIGTTSGFDRLIPTYWLARIALGGFIIMIAAQALTILLCYGRQAKHG